MTIGTGIHLDIPEDDYHNDPCVTPSLSSSIANTLISRSPIHAWTEHPKLGGQRREPTTSMDDGSIVHALLLGRGSRFRLLDFDDYKKKAAQEARDEARSTGYVPVLAHHLADLHKAAEAIRKKFATRGIVLDGESEVTLAWEEESLQGPVPCRGRIDHLREGGQQVIDLKTSRSAHPRSCMKHIVEYGYDVQRAAYVSGLGKLRPELLGRIDFLFIFFEIEPPYCVTPVRLSGEFEQLGASKWGRAINMWARCLQDNVWPDYVEEPIRIEPPRWALSDEYGSDAA